MHNEHSVRPRAPKIWHADYSNWYCDGEVPVADPDSETRASTVQRLYRAMLAVRRPPQWVHFPMFLSGFPGPFGLFRARAGRARRLDANEWSPLLLSVPQN